MTMIGDWCWELRCRDMRQYVVQQPIAEGLLSPMHISRKLGILWFVQGQLM